MTRDTLDCFRAEALSGSGLEAGAIEFFGYLPVGSLGAKPPGNFDCVLWRTQRCPGDCGRLATPTLRTPPSASGCGCEAAFRKAPRSE
jgi:hypothetical protein